MISKKHLKDDFSLIIGGGILIIWGGFISGLPDSYVYSFFGIEDNFNTVHTLKDMAIKDWTERMMLQIGISFILFAINYLISGVGIVIATIGGILAIRDKKEVIQ